MLTRKRYIRASVIIFLALSFLLSLSCSSDKTGVSARKYGDEQVELSDEDGNFLLQTARACLEEKTSEGSPSEKLTKNYSKDVILTVFLPKAPFLRGVGNAGSIVKSLQAACSSAKRSAQFEEKIKPKLSETRIAVNILDKVWDLKSDMNPNKLKKLLEPGWHGIAIDISGKRFFQLGQDIIYKEIAQKGEKRILGAKLVEKRLGLLCKDANVEKDSWRKHKLFRFTDHQFVESKPGGGNAVRLMRGNRILDKKLTRADVLIAIWKAVRNLVMHQQEDGKFGYLYYAVEGKWDPAYSIVRHAGAVWGLFTTYKATGDPKLLESGLKGMEYLKQSFYSPPEHPEFAFLKFGKDAMLGTSALAVLALCEIPEENLTPEYKKIREQFANGLTFFQMDDGSFYTFYQEALEKKPPKKQAEYFPGEAFCAYLQIYKATKNPLYLKRAKLCAEWQMKDFAKTGVPDNWVIQAMAILYQIDPKPEYAKACYEMADYTCDHQWGICKKDPMPFPDYYGAPDNASPPRSTPAGSRNEAMTEAYHLAVFKGDNEQIERYGKSVLGFTWFDISQQFDEINNYFVMEPEAVIGGIRGSLIANDIRIDYNQHPSSAMIRALDVAEKVNGKGTLPDGIGIIDVYGLGIPYVKATEMIKQGISGDAAAKAVPQKTDKEKAGAAKKALPKAKK